MTIAMTIVSQFMLICIVTELVEGEMKDCIKQMIEEIDRIERFYLSKLEEY